MTAFGLLKRISEPDVSSARAEAERLAWMRGEPAAPVAERTFDRYIRDLSGDGRAAEVRFGIESCRVVEELQRASGAASRSDLRGRIGGVLRGFVGDGVDDLLKLGIVSVSGSGWGAVVTLARAGLSAGEAVV